MEVYSPRKPKTHPVFFAELLPILAAFHTWQSSIEGRDVIVFTDNEAARHAFIKGYSPLMLGAEVLACAWLQAASVSASPWFARVPTGSNPADGPSRMAPQPNWQKCLAKVPPKFGQWSPW